MQAVNQSHVISKFMKILAKTRLLKFIPFETL